MVRIQLVATVNVANGNIILQKLWEWACFICFRVYWEILIAANNPVPGQLADMEMKEFLASDESDADEDENDEIADQSEKKHKKKDMYRALLQSGEGSDEDDEDGQDMEVTFNTGLEDLSKRLLEKKDTKSETVWEQHLKKMKEKKKARRNRSKSSSEDESYEDDEPAEETDDFFVDESSVKGGKGKSNQKGKKNKEVDKDAEDKSRAELELLLADENGADAGVKGYNMKRRKGNGKKGKDIPDEGKIPTIDYEDQRFSSLFTSPLFALDPTDPQFKRYCNHWEDFILAFYI